MSRKGKRLVGRRIADRYCITGEIGKGGMGVVFRAIPFDDPSHSVAIKVIQRSGRLGYDDLMRFQKEAAVMSQLHHPNIVVFHELGLFGRDPEAADQSAFGNGYYIVMEIADGNNLKESLIRDGRKDLAYFFQVGLQVSAALDYTHGKNIIHRDIKPHNIIVGKAFRDQRGVLVKVLDFGVASLAEAFNFAGGRDGGGFRGLEEAAGTPLYMAPEQTPLMDAVIDHRIDLYSLGCVLYELLVGHPPFKASSREKLEKQHVFAEPEPLTTKRPDVPKLIEQIVHKLLAKHPNDRYQTAFALHADLLRAKTTFERAGRPAGISFPLGLKDRFNAVPAQLPLIGRDQELTRLEEAYDAVAKEKGRSRITLIKGGAGSGKSRLMAELRSNLARRKVRFISGSFSQHENALPFNALANAFNQYLHRVLKSHPHEAEELRRRIQATLGPVAHKIADVVPGLKPYLLEIPEDDDGEDGTLDLLSNPDGFKTFAKAFSDFTRCLGTDNQPVVFLFDDLHWADGKSLDLIDQFFSNANALQFFLVISQRTGLHVENERFDAFIEKFRKLRRRFTEVTLENLDRHSMRTIVAKMLSSDNSVGEDLVDYLESNSHGNPMHVVELSRSLVARDLIAPMPNSGDWEYDIDALKRAPIQLNTVDLILSRLQEYREFDRQVLGIAATVGLTFQFETLLIGGRTQSVPIMKAIQRAMDEGLVVRVTDDAELKHLGKTYMFAHKKARDAIYESMEPKERRALHKAIGEKLLAAVPQPRDVTLFALAHHFNSAMEAGQTQDFQLAERALTYNRLAGEAAFEGGSYHTSERYFENAWRIIQHWGDGGLAPLDVRASVRETLADLAAIQKNHGKAIRMYKELLELQLPLKDHAALAYKAVYFQTIGGVVSDTAKLIEKTLKKTGSTPPVINGTKKFWMWVSLLVDAIPLDKKRKRLYHVLRRAHQLRKFDHKELDKRTPAIRMLIAGGQLHSRNKREIAMHYHHEAVEEAIRGRGSPGSLVTVVAERAALLGYFGAVRMSYRFLDLAMDTARSTKQRSVYGYVALLRAIIIDYIRDRHEEVSDNFKTAIQYLNKHEHRAAFGLAVVFRVWRELLRCNFNGLYKYSQRMPDVIPTRHWLSPRSVAMMLFGYLLQGARNNIVRHGEMFLKRRKKVAARGNDVFIRAINTMVAFARGEIDRTRESYQETMNDFIHNRRVFLLPFEEDFLGIFAFVLPILFEQEFGRQLMRDAEMAGVLTELHKRLRKMPGKERAVPMLLMARCDELLGRDKLLRQNYDAALKRSKMAGNNLVQVLAYLWFGTLIANSGGKADYLRRAIMLSDKLELKALVDYMRKTLEKRGVFLRDANMLTSASTTRDGLAKQDRAGMPSRLFVEHLNHICTAFDADTGLDEDLEKSFKILAKHYNSGRIFCVFTAAASGETKVIYPYDTPPEMQQIVDYIEPYFNIRSTLFLPLNDAPWIRGEEPFGDSTLDAEDTAQVPADMGTVALTPMPTNTGFDGNSTMVVPTAGGSQTEQAGFPGDDGTAVAATIDPGTGGRGQTVQRGGGLGSGGLQMSALIPLRSDFDSLGVVFIEDVGKTHNRDTTFARQELDQLGVQLGLLVERKIREELAPSVAATPAAKAIYQPASFTLEPTPWVRMWHYGSIRAQRETSWFLGLNLGSDQYLMVYCMLSGSEHLRERIGSMIWHHVHTIRGQIIASGRQQVEVDELREEFTGLFSAIPKCTQLDSIALAFTIFSKEDEVAYSGHFGASRPFVVGVENIVSAHNDVVLNFTNGRDLRYWQVAAELTDAHAYVLSYDTSKLDAAPADTVQKRVALSLSQAESIEDMHRILGSMVDEANLPRYYVAAIVNPEIKGKAFEKLDKAQ